MHRLRRLFFALPSALRRPAPVLAVAALAATPLANHAQAIPSAQRPFGLSTFAGITGAYTGLNGSRNLDFTAGLAFRLAPHYGLTPSIVGRGSYPIDSGVVVGEKNALGGLQVQGTVLRVFRPYGDILFGRGSMVYHPPGYPVGNNLYYTISHGNVLAAGGGVDLALDRHFSLRGDAQLERYATPVTASQHVNSVALTAAIVYNLNLHRRKHHAETD